MVRCAVIIDINSCKNSCIFCNPKGYRRIIDDKELREIETSLLKQVLDLKKLGFKEIEISGCDPIEYRKISNFIRWLKNTGFQYVQLSTHGRNLSDLGLVRALRDAGLDELRIPLYGSDAQTHDSITQVKGSFKETVAGIKNVDKHAPKIRFKLTSLVMRQNYKDIMSIFCFALRFAQDIVFSIPCLRDQVDRHIIAPLSELKPYFVSLLNKSKAKGAKLRITDIPFCMLGFYDSRIINITGPLVMSSTYSIPGQFKSDIPNIPSYRIKTKLAICNQCGASGKCDGFYKSYVDFFNFDHLQPVSLASD